MASAGGGIDGAAVRTIIKKKRISDCLIDSDGGDELAVEDGAPPSPPSPGTPRLRIPMFTCARLRFVRLGKKGGGGERGRKEVISQKSEATSVDSSGVGWKKKQGSNGGSGGAEAAGMGLSLLFLLAKTCVELNKMAEVRAQMEALLEEMRDLQLARTTKISTDNHAAVTGSATRDLQASTTTTASPCRCRASAGMMRTDGHAGAASSSCPEPSRPRHFHERRDESSFYALTGNPLFSLDRAAASTSGMETSSETSSEMEDSMSMAMDVAGGQLRLNNYNTEQETRESSASDGESFIELEGGLFGAGVGSSARRRRRGSDDGHQEDEERGNDEGVSALELERRLQELLHRKSRERIEELESSLRRAERKLMEKDMEARLWKDTAKLALQPPPPQQHDTQGAVTNI